MPAIRAAALALLVAATPAHARPPNLIVVMADDLGAGQLGCYGHPSNRTPHLDDLARTGVRFETAFASPVCHPTRVMLLTGQYGCHNGVYNFAGRRGGPAVKHEGPDNIATHRTFARVLKDAGYATACVGKWQLSGSYPTAVREVGFGEYCLWATRQLLAPAEVEKAKSAGIDFRSRYWHPSVTRNGTFVPTTADDYGPDLHHTFLADFIVRHKDRPFCVYYPMCLTHPPLVSTPDTTRTKGDREAKSAANLRANVEYMDKLIGKLVAVLEKEGLRRDTVIVFTADNGTAGDGKSQATEKGARVPMIVNGPGLVKARGASRELTDLSDVFPTLLDFAGVPLPTDRPIDGHSLKPLPTDRPIDGRSLKPFLAGERETTREWIFAFQADRRVLRTKRWLLEDNSPLHPGRLYDCGDARDGMGYKDVTQSQDAEIVAARKRFDELLAKLPAPVLPAEGAPNERKAKRGAAEP